MLSGESANYVALYAITLLCTVVCVCAVSLPVVASKNVVCLQLFCTVALLHFRHVLMLTVGGGVARDARVSMLIINYR